MPDEKVIFRLAVPPACATDLLPVYKVPSWRGHRQLHEAHNKTKCFQTSGVLCDGVTISPNGPDTDGKDDELFAVAI